MVCRILTCMWSYGYELCHEGLAMLLPPVAAEDKTCHPKSSVGPRGAGSYPQGRKLRRVEELHSTSTSWYAYMNVYIYIYVYMSSI